ncbi:hypothetical protein DPMN_148555 [Dreissena polymorpha]|uniref:Uncharacterized protein n=1 Tax=Dreissena polymorpha TaxID=45954 RepID=A0A9D4FA26_DREPO|nr:hypothetical protein DPMN_148555 [Dreissena polymorpha]
MTVKYPSIFNANYVRHEKDGDFLATADTLLNIAENKIYHTLIKSIPIHIKSEINTNNTPCTQTTFVENILGRKNKPNKIFYTLQIKNPTENSKTQNKWQVLFEEHELNWKHILTMPYKATIESTLRNFQYK